MSRSLLRRSYSISSKLRCSGLLRFRNHRTIAARLPTTVRMPVIISYLRETDEMKSTIFCNVRSGSSPGMTVATAMAAVRTAVAIPTYCCQCVAMLLMMSMSCRLMSKTQLAGDNGAKRAGGRRHNHPGEPEFGFERVSVRLQSRHLRIQMRQLGFEQLFNFTNFLHDPFLVCFNRGDPLIEPMDIC